MNKHKGNMILDDKLIGRILRESLEKINEDDNPAYTRNGSAPSNIRAIWAEIDRKQKELYDYVFGELSGELYDITVKKASVMHQTFGKDYNFIQIPDKICNAGNDKLPANVLIINMSSALMCPSYYLGTCTIKNCACYAMRQENQYSGIDQESVLTNRWKTDIMHTQMLQQYEHGNKVPMKKYFNLVETYIQLGNAYSKNILKEAIAKLEKKYRRPLTAVELNVLRAEHDIYRITDVRLNETGDFHCQLAVSLWDKFATKIKKKYGINTHAYTARHLDFSDVATNIAINASNSGVNIGEDVKPRHFKAVAQEIYDAIPNVELTNESQPILKQQYKGKWFYKCPCGQGESKCDYCGVCFQPNLTGKEYTIFVEYHGLKNATGFKYLFTNDEIQGVMSSLKQHGWVTDDEYKRYESDVQTKKREDTTKNILRLRNAGKKSKTKTAPKETTPKKSTSKKTKTKK